MATVKQMPDSETLEAFLAGLHGGAVRVMFDVERGVAWDDGARMARHRPG